MSSARELSAAIEQGDIHQIKQFSDEDLGAILFDSPAVPIWLHPILKVHWKNVNQRTAQPIDEEILEYFLHKMESYLLEKKFMLNDSLKILLGRLCTDRIFWTNKKNGFSEEKIISYLSRLILLGADVNAYNTSAEYTALYLAVANNSTKIVSLLLLKGADATTRYSSGKTAFELAEEEKKTAILDVMKKHARRILNQYALILDPATGTIKFKNESLSAEKAILKYEQALACDPKNSLIYLFRGIVQSWQGNIKATEQDFAAAKAFGKSGINQKDLLVWGATFKENLSDVLSNTSCFMSLSRQLNIDIDQSDIDSIKKMSDEDLLEILKIGYNKNINKGHPLSKIYRESLDIDYPPSSVSEMFEYFLGKMETYYHEEKLTLDDALRECLTSLSLCLMSDTDVNNWLNVEKRINYVSRLILLGTNVNTRIHLESGDVFTALYLATTRNYAPIVRLLLLKGVDPTIECNGETAFELAKREKKTAVLDVMREHARKMIRPYALTLDTETLAIKFNDDSLSTEKAILQYNQALKYVPKDSLIHLFRGIVHARQGNADAADQDFDIVQAKGRDSIDQCYHRLRAVAFFHQKRFMAARDYFYSILPRKELTDDYGIIIGYSEKQKDRYSFEFGMIGLCHLGLIRQNKKNKDKGFKKLYRAFSVANIPSAFFMPYFCDLLLNVEKGYLKDKDGEEIFAICKKFPIELQKLLLEACRDPGTGLGDRIQEQDSSSPMSTWAFGGLSKKIFQQLKSIDPSCDFPIMPRNFACTYGRVAVGSALVENPDLLEECDPNFHL